MNGKFERIRLMKVKGMKTTSFGLSHVLFGHVVMKVDMFFTPRRLFEILASFETYLPSPLQKSTIQKEVSDINLLCENGFLMGLGQIVGLVEPSEPTRVQFERRLSSGFLCEQICSAFI